MIGADHVRKLWIRVVLPPHLVRSSCLRCGSDCDVARYPVQQQYITGLGLPCDYQAGLSECDL